MSDIQALDLKGFVTNSVKSVFQTMLSMEIELDNPPDKEGICTNGHIVGTVGFAGAVMGTVNLFVSRTFGREMAAAMLGMTVDEVEQLYYRQSGLLGVSGVSNDMRVIVEEAQAGNDRCQLALEMFAYRVRSCIGSYAAAMGGLDAVVFTAGIGENSAEVRERICRDAAWLGLEVDPDANRAGDQRISRAGSRVGAFVVPTNEELMIARHTRAVLAAPAKERTP